MIFIFSLGFDKCASECVMHGGISSGAGRECCLALDILEILLIFGKKFYKNIFENKLTKNNVSVILLCLSCMVPTRHDLTRNKCGEACGGCCPRGYGGLCLEK